MEASIVFYLLAIVIFINDLQTKGTAAKKPDKYAVWDTAFNPHVEKHKIESDRKSTPFRRTTRIYSRVSGKHLQISNAGKIDGSAKETSEFAKLSIVSDTFGRVLIKGVKTRRYICMNKNGRLVGRKNAGRKKKCIFKQLEESNGYTVYKCVKYPTWFIAVNKHGRALTGPMSTEGEKSQHFLHRGYDKIKPTKTAKGKVRRRRIKKRKMLLRMRRRDARNKE